MSIWIKNNLNNIKKNKQKNIVIHFEESIELEVEQAALAFLKWVDKEYIFPQKVMVTFFSAAFIEADDGEMVSATCFLPFDKNDVPYIKISTGDYADSKKKNGRDNALAGILHSVAHEFTHYFQWIKNIDTEDEKMEKQAIRCADYVIQKYACTREHP